MRLDERTEFPRRPNGDDPKCQRHRLADEAAQEADERGAQQNQHYEDIGPGQAFTYRLWRSVRATRRILLNPARTVVKPATQSADLAGRLTTPA